MISYPKEQDLLASIYSKPISPSAMYTSQYQHSDENKSTNKKVHKKLLTTEYPLNSHKEHNNSQLIQNQRQIGMEKFRYLKHLTRMSLSQNKSYINTPKTKAAKTNNNSFIKQRQPSAKQRTIDTSKSKKKSKWSQFEITRRDILDDQQKQQMTKKKITKKEQDFVDVLQNYIKGLMIKKSKQYRKTVQKNVSRNKNLNSYQQKLRKLQQKQKEQVYDCLIQIIQIKNRNMNLEDKLQQTDLQVFNLRIHLQHEIQQRKRFQQMFLQMKKRIQFQRKSQQHNELLSYKGSFQNSVVSQEIDSPRFNIQKFKGPSKFSKERVNRLSQEY